MTDDEREHLRRLAHQDGALAAEYDEASATPDLSPLMRRAYQDAARMRRFCAKDYQRRAESPWLTASRGSSHLTQ